MSVEVPLGIGEVRTFAQTGEGGAVDIVPSISEQTGDGSPTPAPEPTTTDQHVMGHLENLLAEFTI